MVAHYELFQLMIMLQLLRGDEQRLKSRESVDDQIHNIKVSNRYLAESLSTGNRVQPRGDSTSRCHHCDSKSACREVSEHLAIG